nr:unnamed protein product [Digitaria exilis]
MMPVITVVTAVMGGMDPGDVGVDGGMLLMGFLANSGTREIAFVRFNKLTWLTVDTVHDHTSLLLLQIRLQLETLLAEKARLAHENSVYARENRFLREIVEYHQLTMQDVIYVDEGIEEVTEVYPTQILPRTGSSIGRVVTPATPKPAPSSTSIVVPDSCPAVPASPKSLLKYSSLSN